MRRILATAQDGEAGTHRVLAGEADSLDDRVGDLLDRDLLLLANGEDDRVNLVVLLELPDEQLGEVARVDELAQGLARARDDERRAVLCSDLVASVLVCKWGVQGQGTHSLRGGTCARGRG